MAAAAGIPIRRRVSRRPPDTPRPQKPEGPARNSDPAVLPGICTCDKEAELVSVGQIIELGAALKQAAFWRVEVVPDDWVEPFGARIVGGSELLSARRKIDDQALANCRDDVISLAVDSAIRSNHACHPRMDLDPRRVIDPA